MQAHHKRTNRQWMLVIPVFAAVLGVMFGSPMLFGMTSTSYYGHELELPAPTLPPTSSEFRKEPTTRIVFFGFRGCGDVCPTQIGTMQAVDKMTRSLPLEFVVVTLDPRRDTPNALDEWMSSLGNRFVGLRPKTPANARQLAHQFRDFARQTGLGEEIPIEHAGYLHVVTPDGTRRLVYPGSRLAPERVAADLHRLVKEQSLLHSKKNPS